MSMLSSVAERLYWMSRYLERTQDTARLIQAYNHLIMDIPKGAEPPWDIMIDLNGKLYAFFVGIEFNQVDYVSDGVLEFKRDKFKLEFARLNLG